MSKMEGFGKLKKQFADVFMIDGEKVEELRQILEKEQKRQISYKEADEVGRELIGLLECLAGGRKIIVDKENEK